MALFQSLAETLRALMIGDKVKVTLRPETGRLFPLEGRILKRRSLRKFLPANRIRRDPDPRRRRAVDHADGKIKGGGRKRMTGPSKKNDQVLDLIPQLSPGARRLAAV